MEIVIGIIVGAIIGMFCGKYIVLKKTAGSLRVDQSDPDSGPYLFLELSQRGISELYRKKYIVLKINISDYIPHE